MDESSAADHRTTRLTRWTRGAILVGGIVLGQIVLYGPSLSGQKILLPLDLLAQPGWYLPRTPELRRLRPHNVILSDLVLTVEPRRQFAASELRAGRIPLWNPYNFAGSPTADLYSPFDLLYYAFPTPFALAWLQLLKSLVAGLGAYVFFRRVLDVSFWPAAICAWCWPVTGFLVLWQGYQLSHTVAFLPWILFATNAAVRRPRGPGGPALALLVGIGFSSEPAVTAQLLLAAAIFALWCAIDEYGWPVKLAACARGLGGALAAVVLGGMLAMPPLLPLMEYMTTGVRSVDRAQGREERPPVGIDALPQIVLPDLYGSWNAGSRRIVSGNRPESSAAAYAGVIATLVLAPFAFSTRKRRSQQLLWLGLGVLGVAWTIDLPGVVALLRLPGLNLLSHNRFVYLASFSVLSLAAIGLSQLERESHERTPWFWLPAAVLAGLAGWCAFRAFVPPEPLAAELARRLAAGARHARALAGLETVIANFAADSARAATWCALGVGVSMAIALGKLRSWMVPIIGALMLADLLSFAHGIAPQSDPAFAYPEVPVLSEVAAGPGRALCVGCLPPALNRRFEMRDVRGYDGIDPARMVELLESVSAAAPKRPPYAQTMWFEPRTIEFLADGVRIPPALDMLGVRHLIWYGSAPAGATPTLHGGGFHAVENPRALPRVFVPKRFETIADAQQRLEKLASSDFDAREVAYLEVDVAPVAPSRGTASIVREDPQRIEVDLDMDSPGIMVLADLWDVGWKAELNGREVPILRANHALRGVQVPKGSSTLVFRYASLSFAIGVGLASLSLLMLAGWCAAVFASRRRTSARRSIG